MFNRKLKARVRRLEDQLDTMNRLMKSNSDSTRARLKILECSHTEVRYGSEYRRPTPLRVWYAECIHCNKTIVRYATEKEWLEAQAAQVQEKLGKLDSVINEEK